MSSFVPLVCERCQHGWNYKGKALLDPSKRVQCPKCNSTRIIDTLGNKVNQGFKRAKKTSSILYSKNDTTTQQQQNVGVSQQQPNQSIPTNQNQLQQTSTLDLSETKKMLGQPIPSLQQTKQQIQQKQQIPTSLQQLTPTQLQQLGYQPPTTIPAFTGDDFKIIYMLLDDMSEWMTKNKGVRHTVQRQREMGSLLAKMMNKYGVNFAVEVIFIVSHIAYMSPIVFHYYGKTRKGKQETKKGTTPTTPTTPSVPTTEETVIPKTLESLSSSDSSKREPKKASAIFKGQPKTIKDFMGK